VVWVGVKGWGGIGAQGERGPRHELTDRPSLSSLDTPTRPRQIDPKLPINAWLVSLMQESYQRASLMAMMELVAKAQPHAEFAHW
jgi:hypothetical protein